MISAFTNFLSMRYLRPKRSFVSLITIISIGGVALGVWILTAVNAIMTGYSEKVRQTVLGFEPHLVVSQNTVMYDWPDVIETALEDPEVIDAAPFSHGQVVLDHGERPWVVQVQGLDPQPGPLMDRLNRLTVEGEFDLSDDYVVMGKALADDLDLKVGDTILVRSLANGREMLDAYNEGREPENLIVPAELTITGIFSSGRYDYDHEIIFIPLEVGQYLYNLQAGAHGVTVHVADPYQAEQVKYRIYPNLPEEKDINTWAERNQALFEMVSMERNMMSFMISGIIVVAAICFMATMITVTTQKRREIGLLKAIGARTSQIIGVFMQQGLMVGQVGVLIGFLFAFIFLLLRQQIVGLISALAGIEVFSAEIYMLEKLPAHVRILDVLAIGVGAMLACIAASIIPAAFAARMDAAEALRDESTV